MATSILNKQLNRWEQVKRFAIIDRELTVEAGDGRSSLKLKRKTVVDNFTENIRQAVRLATAVATATAATAAAVASGTITSPPRSPKSPLKPGSATSCSVS